MSDGIAIPSLREPGAILLVSCYELGHQPLGTALPAAFLQRAGFAPRQLDLAIEPLAPEAVRHARFVGIATPMHTALRLGTEAARRIRRLNPEAYVCFYGLYAWLNGDHLLEETANAVIGGEVEGALVSLVERLERVGSEYVSPPGVRRHGRPSPSPAPAGPALERLAFPAPSRDELPPLAGYARLVHGGREVTAGYVEASRGCLHHCLHCPIPPVYGGRFFVVPADVVLADVRRLVAAGAGHVTFGDPDFLNGPAHSLRILRAMHAEFPALTFDFTCKVEHILERRGLFPEFAELGCLFVVSAVESLSDRVLGCLEKGHTRADVREALAVVRGAGIALRPSFVAFTPWTTLDDYIEVLDFVDAEGLIDHVDPVQYAIRLLVPPGSALLAKPWMRAHLGSLEPSTFSYHWTHPNPRMDRLHAMVNELVAVAAQSGEDPALTFHRVRAAACAVQETPAPPHARLAPDRPRPPRLTEPWFC